jgi:hypothetical protein
MPIKVNIYDFQCFNQLRNGASFNQNLSEFTPNLVGNVGEKVKVKYFADVEQYAAAEGSQEWNFIELVDDAEVEVDRGSGSFLDDRIQVGDKFQYYADWENRKDPSVNPGFNATVDFISSDGRIMRFTIDSFIAPITGFVPGSYSSVGFSFDQYNATNQNSAAYVRFGLLGNDETFNFNSKVTGSQQIYYVGEMAPAGTGYPAQSLGKIKDWVSGQLEVFFSTSSRDFDAGSYIIEHEFIITPFYLLTYRQFIENDTVPELLEGTNALKYAVELEFRKTLSNTGSSKKAIIDNLAGFVGWYGENFNGLNAKYRVKSIAYEEVVSGDPLDGININVATKATITVENPNAAITDYSCAAYIVRVPQAEEEFIGTQTDLIENFIYKSAIVASPATSASNITTSLNGGDLIIEFTVDYSTAEKLRLTTDDEFLLLVQVEDPTISAGNSDRTMLVADFKNYVDVDYLADFVNVPTYGFLSHPQELGVDGLQNSPTVCNEDGILLDATFGVNTLRDVVVNSLRVALIAYNASENKSFELDNYEFNFGGFVESGGVQQIEVDTTRGYPLPAGDIFNLAKVTTESLVSDYQQYRVLLGQKIKWQEWILNSEVDPVFFQAGEPNNNLNFKSSNYSSLNGYIIKLALVLNVSGEDDLGRVLTGDFINYGGDVIVQDYGVSTDGVTGTIETFDVETGQPLQGDILYNGKDTLFRTTFLNASNMTYAIHRIEPSQNPGDGILELSSLLPSVSNNLLKPLPGETQLKYTLAGATLTTECLIDGSLIQEGVSYKLSARTSNKPLRLDDRYALFVKYNGGTDNPGVQQYVPILNTGGIQVQQNWSIEFRTKALSFPVFDAHPYFGIFTPNGSHIRIEALSATSVFTRFFPLNNNASRTQYVQTFNTVGNWMHVIFVWEQGVRFSTYVNGSRVDNGNNVAGNPTVVDFFENLPINVKFLLYGTETTSNVANVHGFHRGFRFYQGVAIDDVQAGQLYNSDAKEIQEVPVSLQPFLLKEFLLNQVEARRVNDSSVNNMDENLPAGYSNAEVVEGGGAWQDVTLE